MVDGIFFSHLFPQEIRFDHFRTEPVDIQMPSMDLSGSVGGRLLYNHNVYIWLLLDNKETKS
jgi:hypothetical protein